MVYQQVLLQEITAMEMEYLLKRSRCKETKVLPATEFKDYPDAVPETTCLRLPELDPMPYALPIAHIMIMPPPRAVLYI